MVTFHVGDSDLIELDVCDIIATEILRFMREGMLSLIRIFREKLIAVVEEHLRIMWAELEGGCSWGREVTFKDFNSFGAPHFLGVRRRSSVCILLTTWRVPFAPASVRHRTMSEM